MALIIAHRGARSLAPENTLAAARKGFEAGAALWETDVTVTRDNHLILFHDDTLERTTNAAALFPESGSFAVSGFDLEQILTLDAGSFFIRTDPFGQIREGRIDEQALRSFENMRIPTLAQGLELTRALKWQVNLELKKSAVSGVLPPLPEMTVAAVNSSGIDPDRVIISSFHHPWLNRVRGLAPEIRVQALIGSPDDLDCAEEFDTVNVWDRLVDRSLISRMKAVGRKINVFTVNDPDRAAFLIRAGVDGIFTDFPQRFSYNGFPA